MVGVARPVVAFLDAQLANAGEQFFVRGGCDIHFGPLLARADQARPRHLVPFLQLVVVRRGVVEGDERGAFALRKGDGDRHRFGILLRCPGVEGGFVLGRKVRGEPRHVAFGQFALLGFSLFGGLFELSPLRLHGFVFGLVQLRLADGFLFLSGLSILPTLPVLPAEHGVLGGEQLRPIEALVGVAVQGDEHRPAPDHQAASLARRLQALGEVQLLEQRTDRIRHVLHDLPAREVSRRRLRHPFQLDGLHRQVGDGAGLQEPQFAVAIRPLHILRGTLQFFHFRRGFGEFPQHDVAQRWTFALGLGNLREPRALFAIGDDLAVFGAHRRLFRGVCAAIDHIGVRRHLAADDGFAEPETGVDDHLAALAGGGIGGEEDAGDIGRHHQLHHHGHGHGVLIDAVLVPVGDGLRRPQRRPALAHGGHHRVRAGDVQVGFLLPGEGEIGQVFGGGRRAHRHRWRVRQHRVGGANGAGDVAGHVVRGEQRLNVRRGPLEGNHAVLPFRARQAGDPLRQAVVGDEPAVGGGGDVESARHVEAAPRHARQRPPLAADDLQGVALRGKRRGEGVVVGHGRHRWLRNAYPNESWGWDSTSVFVAVWRGLHNVHGGADFQIVQRLAELG